MRTFVAKWVAPAAVCIALTVGFWAGSAKVRSYVAWRAEQRQLLENTAKLTSAVVDLLNYNIQQGKLAIPPAPPPAKK